MAENKAKKSRFPLYMTVEQDAEVNQFVDNGYTLPRSQAHLRHSCAHNRCGCQNTVGNPWAYQCKLHCECQKSSHK